MQLVLVESPYMYRHDDPAQRAIGLLRHLTYARLALHDCLVRGEAPYCSHLLYTQPGILDDDIPEQRQHGIDAGLAWGAAAGRTVVYEDLGMSRGMSHGVDNAIKAGRPIEYRRLAGWRMAQQEDPAQTLLRLSLSDPQALVRVARDALAAT